MSLRHQLAVLLVALSSMQGCCCLKPAPWPCGRTYYGTQCGCFYWHEWFSHKPPCCEPCNTCGTFTRSTNPYVKAGPPYTRFGAIYSDGTGGNSTGGIGQLYNAPSGPTPATPPAGTSPAAEPEGVMDALPDSLPVDELPGPTTSLPDEMSGGMAANRAPVDSPRYSRTLGRPPRRGLFTR